MKMASNDYISISCLEVIQPIGKFYITVLPFQDLLDIAYADVRKVEAGTDDLGIQRHLAKGRKEEIGRYVLTREATFPTSILLAISSRDAEIDNGTQHASKSKKPWINLRIPRRDKVARIIDGQHRIAGLLVARDVENGIDRFDLPVTIFVDMDIEDQAMVFATINLKQTRVTRSLAFDLTEFAKTRSPYKTGHHIAVALDKTERSPFHGRVKVLGTASEPSELISQAAIVEVIADFILGTDARVMDDRDLVKRGKKPERATEREASKLIFRNFWIDNQDEKIAQTIFNLFYAVRKKWPKAWNKQRKGHVLNRATGFRAMMRFLRAGYLSIVGDKPRVPSVDEFHTLLKKVKFDDDHFTTERYKPGSSGVSSLYNDLVDQAKIKKSA
jgi:DGQHR domain-containing protein